ncbi:MAG: class I tRNA ligase family protein [Thermoguttaceae bacterium]
MAKYDFKAIEEKWQNYWLENKSFEVKEDKPKKYFALSEFPGPTAKGIHVGNARCYTNPDVNARYKRFCGYNVLQPIGWDAFGLPTENFALKMGIDPRVSTNNNIERFTKQFIKLGGSYDWSRELSTTDPEFYKWTQFIFLKLYEKGLAYRSKAKVNFCPKCNSTLSNEDSQGGVCDRCGSAVEQKERDVWFLKITAYADRMLELLDKVDYPESVKEGVKQLVEELAKKDEKISKGLSSEEIEEFQVTTFKISLADIVKTPQFPLPTDKDLVAKIGVSPDSALLLLGIDSENADAQFKRIADASKTREKSQYALTIDYVQIAKLAKIFIKDNQNVVPIVKQIVDELANAENVRTLVSKTYQDNALTCQSTLTKEFFAVCGDVVRTQLNKSNASGDEGKDLDELFEEE